MTPPPYTTEDARRLRRGLRNAVLIEAVFFGVVYLVWRYAGDAVDLARDFL